MLCVLFAEALRAETLPPSDWTVLEGFQEAPYAVSPPPASSPSASVVPSIAGVNVAFATAQPGRFVTSADNVAQSAAESRVHVQVEIWKCGSRADCRNVGPSADETLNVWINPDFHIYSTKTVGSKVSILTVSVTPSPPPSWAGVVTIPWDQVPVGAFERVIVNLAYVDANGPDSPKQISDAVVGFVSAFGSGWDPSFDHRILSASKTAQWVKTEESAPTPTPAPRWPSVSIDANYPASANALGGLTFAQNSANVLATLQKKIASAAVAAGPTKSTPAPCAACQTFETRYSSMVGLAASTSTFTSDAPAVAGIDAQPFSLQDVNGLGFGGVESYWSNSVGATLAQTYTKGVLDDEALTIADKLGASQSAQLTVFAATRSHPAVAGATPPPAPLAPPNLHLSTYAASLAWPNPTLHDADPSDNGSGRFEASNVVVFLRDAYDATDSASDAFGGIEFFRQSVDKGDGTGASHGWQADTAAAIPGYRSSALNYRTLDGDALAYPFSAGPTVTAGFSDASNYGFLRKITVASYWLKNALGDVDDSDDYVLSDQLRPSRSFHTTTFSYEVNRSSISAPLLAATQTSGFAYPALRGFIVSAPGASPAPAGTFEQSDNTGSISYASPQDAVLQYQLKFGRDFDHLSAQCQPDPDMPTHVFCAQRPTSRFYTFAALFNAGPVRIGFTSQPTQYAAGRTLVTAERVYNDYLQASIGKSVTVQASASNDTGVLVFVPLTRLVQSTNVQVNVAGFKGIGGVLSIGSTNQNGFQANLPGEGLNFSQFPQRVVTTFVFFRIGTPALQSTPPSPGY